MVHPRTLAEDLDEIARRTWQRVRWGPLWGMTLREDGITDENLFQLRLAHPYLNVKKFTWKQEVANGADWEWWLGSDVSGWVGLRIQAKKMLDLRYDELGHRARSQTRIQCQVLIEETEADARGRSLYPLYCFYNGWDEGGGWPSGVPWTVGCGQPANCPTVPDVRVFGCSLARAHDVHDILVTSSDPLDASASLPCQRPWSWLFGGSPLDDRILTSASVHDQIVAALALQPEQADRPRFAELPAYAAATREDWPVSDLNALNEAAPTTYVVVADLGRADEEPSG